MYHKLHTFLLLLICLVGQVTQAIASDTPEISDADVLAFLDDPDSLLAYPEDSESLAIQDEITKPEGFLYLVSARIGIGHSDNFLKKYREQVKSDYTQLEVDAFASWLTGETELSLLIFSEATIYEYNLEASDESMSMAQIRYQRSRGNFDFGVESSASYGSFIYDSSLTELSVPSGTQISQFYPELKIFADWYGPDSNLIRFGLSGARAEFNVETLNYWDPKATLEWVHLWESGMKTTSEMEFSRQIYDSDVARDQKGDSLSPDQSLSINRFSLNQRLQWQPASVKWLSMDISAGYAWENENAGNYESLDQSWVKGRFIISNSWGKFEFSGRWGEYRYDERWITETDNRIALQTNRSLTIEYSRSLPWNLSVIARNQWNSLSSRDFEDSYSERRTELLMEWSY